jgi:hypothetical protein
VDLRRRRPSSADKKHSSDADAGVLADYVIALVVADDSLANIKRSCIESLEDFLNDCEAWRIH